MLNTPSREAHAAMTQAVREMMIWGSVFTDTQARLAAEGIILDGFLREKTNEVDPHDA